MNWHYLVDEYLPTLIAIRRQLHRYPELAFQEVRTAEVIASTLVSAGLEVKTGVALTGVTGLIRGVGPRTVAVRADMDALPIQEQSQAPYASTVPNVMHACGHDGHMAIALGAALVLQRLRHHLPGSVKFIFQPAEEGPGGAQPMIAAGVLTAPEVEAVFGFHLYNSLPAGQIGLSYGQTCAATDEIKITIVGQGGHGAHPHQTVDAVVVAAQVVTALQTVVSRQISPLDAAVVTIGSIRGGYANNVIADRVELWGTVRTLSEQLRAVLPTKIEQIVSGVTAAHGAAYEFVCNPGYPPLITDHALTALIEASAARVVGPGNVVRLGPSMGGEDFAYFAQAAPAAFFRIGSGGEAFPYPGHHPRFDFDETAIGIGVRVLVQTVLDYFQSTAAS
ncbi:M20 metallopeptidase family protein [Sporolituus thermophilus]|uniref:Amidohydrolase n=1 Tax=Sporolituus thermophilus DSM 23256 TaxID=1123285 RepID=A0A1G7MMB5_9FIRM|nr:amidohydrolase [Sporolituus thermophilus]SDF62998.1 amidohydrolase [Sporolituus thermophilus DSM 23256]